MPILALGVSYRRASVDLLERLAFADDDFPKAYRRLRDFEPVREAVVLSTCNRIEVYGEVASYHAGFLELKRFLSEAREVRPEELAEPLYAHYEDEAAEHLFGVASGIDSMVLGEPQILSQVRSAFRRAELEGTAGSTLSALFRGAIRTGRRVRAETKIGASPAAFVEAGADMASAALGGLEGRSVLVVGAGAMAKLAVDHLRERGAGHIRVANRTVERARALAARAGTEPAGLHLLVPAMADADLVVCSTGAAGVVIDEGAVREAVDGRPADRPLFLLDLAVPRDVDPAAGSLPGVTILDIDGLRAALSDRTAGVVEEVGKARAVVDEEVARFSSWRRASRLAPLIQALRERGDSIAAAELARALPRLSGLSERERQTVHALVEGIVAKLLHDPIVRLKQSSASGGGAELARAIADLFGLDALPGI